MILSEKALVGGLLQDKAMRRIIANRTKGRKNSYVSKTQLAIAKVPGESLRDTAVAL